MIADSIQWLSILTAGAMTADMEFKSYDDAVATRDFILEKIDGVMESGIPDDLYIKFRDLRTAIVDDIESGAGQLARIINTSIPENEPAVVLYNSLYGSLDGETDIIERNFVEHPGFVSGVKMLEVLSNV